MNAGKGCLIVLVVLFMIGYFMQSCEESNKKERTEQLSSIAKELSSKYHGKYVGIFVTGLSVPSAGIYPENVTLSIDIGDFQPMLAEDMSSSSVGKSDKQETLLDHLSAGVSGIWFSESESPMYTGPVIRYYPQTKTFCALSLEGTSASSFFGGDICEIEVTENFIKTPKGTLYKSR